MTTERLPSSQKCKKCGKKLLVQLGEYWNHELYVPLDYFRLYCPECKVFWVAKLEVTELMEDL